jgi:hypothetical protein
MTPLFPFPEASPTVMPAISSNPYAATRPAGSDVDVAALLVVVLVVVTVVVGGGAVVLVLDVEVVLDARTVVLVVLVVVLELVDVVVGPGAGMAYVYATTPFVPCPAR